MGSAIPAPPNYKGAAEQTSQGNAGLNRLNTQNAWGGGVQFGPEGARQTLTGPLGDLSQSLMGQAGQSMGSAFDPSGLPQVGTGQEATDASYKAYTSRLDPQWASREDAERTRLTNQGLDPSSAAFRDAMGQLGQQRNDAYGQAYGQSVGLGQAQRGQDMQSRQMAWAEALQRRGLPMQELQQLRGLTEGQPQYNQVAGPDYMGAEQLQDASNYGRYNDEQGRIADYVGGGANLLSSILATIFSGGKPKV